MSAQPFKSRPPGFDVRTFPDDVLMGAVVLVALLLFLAWRLATARPFVVVASMLVTVVVLLTALRLRARLLDRRAAGFDPPPPGVIIGTVKGDWLFAGERPYRIPFESFHQHPLIAGPTGRGKTFTFVEPFLRAMCQRRQPTGLFYLDGKGDRVDRQPGINFDCVFCPEDPATSARWNPLAGPNPIEAAAMFASALFPAAAEDGANFYEARAVYAISKVAPAMAFTGYGVEAGGERAPESLRLEGDALHARLVSAGLSDQRAERHLRRSADCARRQLAWHFYRDDQSAEALDLAIAEDWPAPAGTPGELLGAETYELVPADLNRVLFSDALGGLADGIDVELRKGHHPEHARTLAQLRHDVAAITTLDGRERAAIFQSLQNRLGYFLEPPFLSLCSSSDFRIEDVTRGTRMAFLLPTGRFPNAARPLGRIALSQFKNAVLSSPSGVNKIAVLDEFHNFVSGDFGAFLNQARSRGGGAVMAMQSLADFPHAARQAMLANVSTRIVTPGCSPDDAAYFADVFGKELRERISYSYERPRSPWGPRQQPSERVDHSEEYRHSPTAIAEFEPGWALIQVTLGRRTYPVAKVRVERG